MNLDLYLNRGSHSRSTLARISGRVKLVYGSEDVAYPESYSEEFLQRLNHAGVDASLDVIPNVLHYMVPNFRDELNPILHKFIVATVLLNFLSAPIPSHVKSLWEDALRRMGWNSEENLFNDDLIIHPRPNSLDTQC